MSISFNGYKNNVLTFENGGAILAHPVTLDSEGKATTVSTGSEFIGVCTAINGDYVSVQTDGYIEMKYTNSPPPYGLSGFTSGSLGAVIASDPKTASKAYTVVKVDTVNKIVGFIL